MLRAIKTLEGRYEKPFAPAINRLAKLPTTRDNKTFHDRLAALDNAGLIERVSLHEGYDYFKTTEKGRQLDV